MKPSTLVALCMLAACGSNSPSSTTTPTPPTTASATPPVVECFDGGGAVRLPDGTQVMEIRARAKRTLKQAEGTIIEEFENLSPRPETFVVTIRVDGDSFTMTEANNAFEGRGTLFGEPWKWTSWKSTSILADGTRVESHDSRVEGGLNVKKSVFDAQGTLQVTIVEEFKTVPCSG